MKEMWWSQMNGQQQLFKGVIYLHFQNLSIFLRASSKLEFISYIGQHIYDIGDNVSPHILVDNP